jgi:membrane-bound inhibitor of C-type lysozyme
MKIEWKKVTWYSTVLAIILYLATFFIAFYLGQRWEQAKVIINQINIENQQQKLSGVINDVSFDCVDSKTIQALFFKDKVEISLSDGRNMVLLQAISASGARYANTDESFVFWTKGDTAFIQEGDTTTYQNCIITPKQ